MAKLGLESRFAVWFTGLFCQSLDELCSTSICLMEESLFMQLLGSNVFVQKQGALPLKLEESVTVSISIFLNSNSKSLNCQCLISWRS